MSQALIHTTREGERWDSIAWDYYQDVSMMGLLIESNQHIPIMPSLPAGLQMVIPLIEKPAESQGLPPWKRQ